MMQSSPASGQRGRQAWRQRHLTLRIELNSLSADGLVADSLHSREYHGEIEWDRRRNNKVQAVAGRGEVKGAIDEWAATGLGAAAPVALPAPARPPTPGGPHNIPALLPPHLSMAALVMEPRHSPPLAPRTLQEAAGKQRGGWHRQHERHAAQSSREPCNRTCAGGRGSPEGAWHNSCSDDWSQEITRHHKLSSVGHQSADGRAHGCRRHIDRQL